ncbi:hypothetical protein AB0891_00690 [Streptomyces sp. NPDC007259]|uniref:hypothetical protein n=1 Tax=Streptomyces sp. NPDC007259 TaxID=3154319 RepID=UPI003456A865
MRSIRIAGVLALLVLVAACGGNAPAPAPSPSAAPPVSVSLENIGRAGDTRLGLALHLHNDGRTRPGTVVRVHIGEARGGDPLPGLEEKTGTGWKDIALTADADGSAGTFRMTLPKGGLLGFLGVTPHAGPRVDGDEIPVDVTLLDGARTLARGHGSVRPAALSLDRAVLKEPATLGRGRWAEVTYTVTNRSHRAYPQAQVQAEFGACESGPDNPAEGAACSVSQRRRVTTELSTQWYDGGRWKDVSPPDDGTLLADTLTLPLGQLPADTRRKVRLRFAGTGQLDAEEHLLTLTARANGKAVGASERSLGIAPPLTFALR